MMTTQALLKHKHRHHERTRLEFKRVSYSLRWLSYQNLSRLYTDAKEDVAYLGRLHWVHWVAVALTFCLTLAAWYFATTSVDDRLHQKFDRRSDLLIEHLRDTLQKYESLLRTGVVTIRASGGAIANFDWSVFSRTLEVRNRYPGIQSVGIADLTGAGGRYLVSQIEPGARKELATGYDLSAQLELRQASAQVNEHRRSIMSTPFQYPDTTPSGYKTYLFIPVAEGEATDGEAHHDWADQFVFAVIDIEELLKQVVERVNRQIKVRLTDQSKVLFEQSQVEKNGWQSGSNLSKQVDLDVFGRLWNLQIWSDRTFPVGEMTAQPLVILVAGLGLNTLLLTLFAVYARSNARTVQYAESVQRLADKLEHKAEDLARSNRDLGCFAYVASHDLRAPLRGVSDLVEYLHEDLQSYLGQPDANPEVKKNLNRIESQIRRMNHLITGILEYSTAGRSSGESQRIDVTKTLLSIARDLRLDDGQLVIENDMPVFHTQATRLEQIFMNLLANAVKHAESKPVTIWVNVLELGQFYRFSVRDNGPGIDPLFHEKVFEVFQKLKPRDEVDGAGIGLAVVKKAVESLGGRVMLESTPGEGSTFTFDWPQAIVDAPDN